MFAARSKLDKGIDAFERGEWKRARRLLEAALQDEPRAAGFYHLGLLYWRGLGCKPDKTAAVDCFARAAEFGHPGAQTAFGIALRSGVGTLKDNDQARAQFRSAAGAGDREAMVQLATMSEPEDARRWLMRASELGYAPAMAHLSDLLIQRDSVEALSWLYAAVTLSGDDAARKRAAALAKEMTPKDIEQAQRYGRAYAREIRERVEK
jgi:TPR repeat protein